MPSDLIRIVRLHSSSSDRNKDRLSTKFYLEEFLYETINKKIFHTVLFILFKRCVKLNIHCTNHSS